MILLRICVRSVIFLIKYILVNKFIWKFCTKQFEHIVYNLTIILGRYGQRKWSTLEQRHQPRSAWAHRWLNGTSHLCLYVIFHFLYHFSGVINNLSKFDASFFGIHSKQVNAMDIQARIALECAYEAIMDAGIHPQSLRNTKTGVYYAVSFSDAERNALFKTSSKSGFMLMG